MELKKMLHFLPRMALEAILLMVLIGVIAFCGVKGMEKEPFAAKAEIAIVMEEENKISQMAISFIEGMESVSQYCDFVQVSYAEGFRMLREAKVAAVLVLPQHLVEGIMDGTNPSVEVYFPVQAGVDALLFRELTEAGGRLLRVAQAEIYGANDAARDYNMMEDILSIETEIDRYNLSFALERLALYESKKVSATGTLSVAQHYAASGIVLFLMLSGMALYPTMQPETCVFRRQMRRHGVGNCIQGFCQWFCGLLGLCIVISAALILGILCLKITGRDVAQTVQTDGIRTLLWAGVILIAVTAYLYFLYSLSGSKTTAILLVFLLSLGMLFLSGGLVPSVFLPRMAQKVGERLPTAYLMQAAGIIVTGKYNRDIMQRCLAGLLGYTALFGILSFACREVLARRNGY